MKIKFKYEFRDATHVFRRGREYDLPEDRAEKLIRDGFAVASVVPEEAITAPEENAMARGKRNQPQRRGRKRGSHTDKHEERTTGRAG